MVVPIKEWGKPISVMSKCVVGTHVFLRLSTDGSAMPQYWLCDCGLYTLAEAQIDSP